jgi:hypothetical protein
MAARSAGFLRVETLAIVGARARAALSSAHWGTAPRELPFERGEPIAKRSVLGFLIAQSLGEVAGNEHEKPEQPDQHELPPR